MNGCKIVEMIIPDEMTIKHLREVAKALLIETHVIVSRKKLEETVFSLKKDYDEYSKEIKKQSIPIGTDECGLRIARASKFALIQFIETRLLGVETK